MYLYKELSVGAEGSDARTIWRANPDVEGRPWFDDVLILAATNSDGSPVYELGRLLTFVRIEVLSIAAGSEDFATSTHIMALVHMFCAPGTHGQIRDVYHKRSMARYDTRAGAFNIPFPMMELAYTKRSVPIYHMIDTESISSAVWTHCNLDDSRLFWVLREPGDAVAGYDLRLHLDYETVCSDFSSSEQDEEGEEEGKEEGEQDEDEWE